MENNLQIGVVLKKRENIKTPEKTIYGYFKEEEKKFVDVFILLGFVFGWGLISDAGKEKNKR